MAPLLWWQENSPCHTESSDSQAVGHIIFFGLGEFQDSNHAGAHCSSVHSTAVSLFLSLSLSLSLSVSSSVLMMKGTLVVLCGYELLITI
jgi:hypothetical protein